MTRNRDVANVLTAASALSTDIETAAAITTHASAADPHTAYALKSGTAFTGHVGLGPIVTGAFNRGLSINSESGQYAGIQLVNSSTGTANTDGSALFISNSALILSNREAASLTLATSGAERMIIEAGGNVGIGTSSPTTKFTVNGDANVINGFTAGTGIGVTSGKIIVNSSASVTGANWNDSMLHLTGINAADSNPGMTWHAPGASAISLWHVRGTQALQIMGHTGVVDNTAGRMTLRNIAVSTSAASGGADGDVWLTYTA
jgi:hypothetical protein